MKYDFAETKFINYCTEIAKHEHDIVTKRILNSTLKTVNNHDLSIISNSY